jgi:hypothetical protein
MAINWCRGLLRLWLSGSVLWISYAAWELDIPCLLGFDYGRVGLEKEWCSGSLVNPGDVFRDAATHLLGFPIIFGIIAAALYWTVRGFDSRTPN